VVIGCRCACAQSDNQPRLPDFLLGSHSHALAGALVYKSVLLMAAGEMHRFHPPNTRHHLLIIINQLEML